MRGSAFLCIALLLSGCVSSSVSFSERLHLEMEQKIQKQQVEMELLRRENRVLRQELDQKIRGETSQNTSPHFFKKQSSVLPVESEEDLYASMQVAYQQKDEKNLLLAYEKIKAKFPQSILLDKALFLVGDLYAQQGKYAKALQTLNQIEVEFPNSSKRPSAQLVRSNIFFKMSLVSQARDALSALIRDYPGSPESQRAQLELKYLDHLESVEMK